MERYEAKSLCQHSQTSIEHVQLVFEILMKLKICPISHNTLTFVYQNYMYIEGCHSIKWRDMKLNGCVSIHRHLKNDLVEISIIDINIVQAINIGSLTISSFLYHEKSLSSLHQDTYRLLYYPFATVLRCIGNTAYVCKIAWNGSLVWN